METLLNKMENVINNNLKILDDLEYTFISIEDELDSIKGIKYNELIKLSDKVEIDNVIKKYEITERVLLNKKKENERMTEEIQMKLLQIYQCAEIQDIKYRLYNIENKLMTIPSGNDLV